MLTVSDNHIVLGGGGGGGGGDVVGAASSTDNAVARFDGTTGKVVQDSSVTVTDAGSVGIGTTSPGAKLHVMRGTGGSSPVAEFDIMTVENSATGYVNFITPETARSGFIFSGSTRANGGFIYTNADTQYGADTAQSLIFLTNGFAARLLIDKNGSVGIGTMSPSQKLHVSGNLRVTGAYFDSTNSRGTNGQVLKNVGGFPVWSNP